MSEVVINVTKVEEVVTINATPNVTQILVNTNSGGGIQSVVAGTNITIDDTDPLNPIISASGGGGAVDSVNGQTGVVVLDANDVGAEPTITSGTTSQYYRGDKTFQTLDKSAVGLSNVVNSDTTTTANITDSTNKRFVTDANLTTIGNTSGTNSGDNATNTTSNAYADAKVEDAIVNGVTTKAPSQNAVFDALALKVDLTSWVDYSATSTIGGFSSLTANILRYIERGGFIYYYFNIGGVSNGATFTFTTHVPHAGGSYFAVGTYNVNNSTVSNSPPRIAVVNGSSTVTILRDYTGTTWATSNNKQVSGMVVLQKI